MIKANRFETRPLYLQVRDMLLGRITTGNWKPGTLIPNEVDLAREFGLSVGTVRKALDQLQAEHLVTRRQGRGTFVNDLASDEHTSRFSSLFDEHGKRVIPAVRLIAVKVSAANDDELRQLELQRGASVISLVRLRSAAGRTFMHETSVVPASLFSRLADDPEVPDEIPALAQKYGQIVGSAEEMVTIIAADADVAKEFAIEPGSPLMRLERRAFAMDGSPVEWRRAICNIAGGHYRSQIT